MKGRRHGEDANAKLSGDSVIRPGREGENGAMRIVIGSRVLQSEYGEGEAAPLHRRVNEKESYRMKMYVSGVNLIRGLTSNDMAQAGCGIVEP